MSKASKRSSSRVHTKTKEPERAPLYVEILRDTDVSRGVKRSLQSTTAKVVKTTVKRNESSLGRDLVKKILTLAEEDREEPSLLDGEKDEADDANSVICELSKENDFSSCRVDSEGFVDLDDDHCMSDVEKLLGPIPVASGESKQLLLSDLILEKIRAGDVTSGNQRNSTLDPQIVEIYESIGTFLSRYRSGKIPKAFKIIPSLANWEEILCLTKPVDWTPNAMCEAVRIFSSNLNSRMAQRFYNLVLLPVLRENVRTYKKLNFHYYNALKLAMYKPSAWFQGILFPLLRTSCTLREAVIFGSVLAKLSIPPLHVAAALVRCSNFHHGNTAEWSICTSYMINILLNKKCALPKMAVNAVAQHFMTFLTDTRQLPVLWHQSLLTFIQRYKFALSPGQISDLRNLLKVHSHYMITPDIRRELSHAKAMEWTSLNTMDVSE